MSQLPEARVTRQEPFNPCEVDYAGTLNFDYGDDQETRGLLLAFTCLITRAVHLELVNSGDVGDFLLALNRMANGQGTPSHIYSDHALTFKKAKAK